MSINFIRRIFSEALSFWSCKKIMKGLEILLSTSLSEDLTWQWIYEKTLQFIVIHQPYENDFLQNSTTLEIFFKNWSFLEVKSLIKLWKLKVVKNFEETKNEVLLTPKASV